MRHVWGSDPVLTHEIVSLDEHEREIDDDHDHRAYLLADGHHVGYTDFSYQECWDDLPTDPSWGELADGAGRPLEERVVAELVTDFRSGVWGDR